MHQRLASALIGCLSALLLLAACSSTSPLASRPPSRTATAATVPLRPGTPAATERPVTRGQLYTDAKLGFQLTIPRNWQAKPQPGRQASPGTTAVTFTSEEQSTHAVIILGVFQGSQMVAAFKARGEPETHIGPYPAFIADRTLGEARAPCLVRIFLAGDDYVLADWCAPTAFAHRVQFEQILATYLPASSPFVPQKLAIPVPQSCADMQQQLGYSSASWGRPLASPGSAGWGQAGPGTFICSNDGSSDWYLFQCTELANRYLYERWALPHIPGNAARYYDYYQNGVYHPGTIRTFPAGTYQVSSDASQGPSAFRPVAGDLLIFQDVNNPRVGWTSGLTDSPGHVAVIVGVDNAFVYIAQENYNDTQYFLALPIHKVASGYEITDQSGWSQRIVRGWIHFTVNGGLLHMQ